MNPGPIFPSDAATAVSDVVKSYPPRAMRPVPAKMIAIYVKIKPVTDSTVSIERTLPFISILTTAFGWSRERTPLLITFETTTILEILIPPEVDDAHPPMNMRQKRSITGNGRGIFAGSRECEQQKGNPSG